MGTFLNSLHTSGAIASIFGFVILIYGVYFIKGYYLRRIKIEKAIYRLNEFLGLFNEKILVSSNTEINEENE